MTGYNVIVPDPAHWDAFVAERDGHILQTSQWGALKSAFGWEDQIVALAQNDDIVAGALLLYRSLPFKLGTLAYAPLGPVVDWHDQPLVTALLTALQDAARARNAIALKIEPDLFDAPAHELQLKSYGFKQSPHTIQPPRTILIDIAAHQEDHILMRMSQSTRRKVRIPYKKEVNFRRGNVDDLASFNQIIQQTGSRNEFGVHSPAYYQLAYDLFAPRGQVALLMASYEGQDLGGIMVFVQGSRAWYLYGASSDAERKRMPTYGLQWEAIRWAREQGCSVYDMWGIPDEDEQALEDQFQQRGDGLWGVYGFKRGFGGKVTRTIAAWDRPYRPFLYKLYSTAVRLRGVSD